MCRDVVAEHSSTPHLIANVIQELAVVECGVAFLDGDDARLAPVVVAKGAVCEREKGAEAVQHTLRSACTQASGLCLVHTPFTSPNSWGIVQNLSW